MGQPLKGGAVRLLGKHIGKDGRAFRRSYDALAEQFDLASSKLARLEASRVALAWVNLESASRVLIALRQKRDYGKGRRPSRREVERAARRQGLADASYSQALDKLRLLARERLRTRVPATPEAMLAAMQEIP